VEGWEETGDLVSASSRPGESDVSRGRSAPAVYSRPAARIHRVRFTVVSVLLAAYLLGILIVTLTPTPVDRPHEGTLSRVIEEMHGRGLGGWVGYTQLEFAGNVLLFLPAGFLAALLLPRRDWWLAAVLAPAFSALLECAQAVFLPDRVSSVRDVLANGAGGAAGAALGFLAWPLLFRGERLLARLRRRRPAG
jgi:VanZ family protein